MGIHGKPAWLEALYREKFFTGCLTHESSKKNEKNICCLDCCCSICPHCVPSHRFHRLVQIRRYVYHDVVRLEDLEKLIDCSNVQSYTINSAKVVFIKKRPQSRQFKGSGNFCTSCDRSLQEPYIHCSLGCKVDFVLKHKKNLSSYLRACNSLQLSPDFLIPTHEDNGGGGGDYEMMMMMNEQEDTPHSTIVDSDEPMMSYSSSGSGSENNMDMSSMVCRDFVRKKRSSGGSTGTGSGLYVCGRSASRVSISNHHHHHHHHHHHEDMATSVNSAAARRKGIPHRSPLC